MNKQALGSAIAGGAITAALIEVLFEKQVLSLDEARAVLQRAMRLAGPYVQTDGGLEASQIISGLLAGKFSAR